MTDHLTNARACLSRVDQAATHFSDVAWLTATCEHILDHLEAQQTEASLRRGLADITAGRTVDLGSFAQPATAQPAAQQGDSGHRDGGEAVRAVMAVLCDMGADSGGWHSWRCFDRLYPEPCDCTKQAARAAVAAAEPHIRADLAAHDAEVRAQALAPIREALAGHPRCDIHPDDDPITCGWKRAVFDVQSTLDRADQIERGE